MGITSNKWRLLYDFSLICSVSVTAMVYSSLSPEPQPASAAEIKSGFDLSLSSTERKTVRQEESGTHERRGGEYRVEKTDKRKDKGETGKLASHSIKT